MATVPNVTTTVVTTRFQWNLSLTIETTVSMREMEEVIAAKKTSRKNSVPTTPPIDPMALKTWGRVMNIRPGPALIPSAEPPLNATTEGMMIRPARRAIPVSNISIWRTLFSMLSSFFIYEP